MDLCAEMLLAHLGSGSDDSLRPERICPTFRRRFTRLPIFGGRRSAFNADRLFNRHCDFPSHLRRIQASSPRREFDAFHVVDHSYAQLVHALPADRTGVYLHDLDAFRSLLEPNREPRPRWFRLMMRRVLTGLQKAALVFYSTAAVRSQVELHGLLDPTRLVHAPYGVCPEFTPDELGRPPGLPPEIDGRPFLLHVGSCNPRKRIDVLLDVFGAVRARLPDLRMVKVGGEWSDDQRRRIDRLGVSPAVRHLTGVDRPVLAALYRRAAAVLQPSEAEGFGIPVAEALACGAPVVASDLPVLREVGGDVAVYCPVADIPAWTDAVTRLIETPALAHIRPARVAHAARFSWVAQARTIADEYLRLVGRGPAL
ncbi:MAG TPA: glycosyltransferase [Gemmataceae bacterium]|jgi:glycosyltransferase involved in cell wall biosynthesis|nr:glycosyltransferase [Gemmataceae bacterium]